MRIAIFASHGGSNLQAIIDAQKARRLTSRVYLVISNNRKAMALQRATTHQIENAVINSANYPDETLRDQAIAASLKSMQIDLVVLAGYLKKLGHITLSSFRGRIINIHPSLLPKHGGRGMYGLNVHQAVINSRETMTGVTVHWVDEAYDTGAIFLQKEMPVLVDDSPESLQTRVLQKEHEVLVEAIQLLEQEDQTREE